MAKDSIKFSTIRKRSQYLSSNSVNESTNRVDSEKLYQNLTKIMERSKTGNETSIQSVLRSYLESLCNTENINQYYWQIPSLVSEFNKINTNVSDKIIYEFSNRILPYMENPSDVARCLDEYDIKDYQADSIIESVSLYNAADRIIKNDKMISKRYNTSTLVNRYRSVGLKYFVDACSDMISTYSVPKYQKMNIALEECSYILDKNGIKENRANIAKYVIEYFLLLDPILSYKDLDNFRRTVKESYVLEESDLSQIQYLFEDTIEVDSVDSAIKKFLMSTDKESAINNIISDAIDASTQDIIYNTDELISTLWNTYKHEILESDDTIFESAKAIANYISEASINSDEFSKDDISHIIESLEDVSRNVLSHGNYNSIYANMSSEFINKAINPCLEALSDINSLIYSKSNLDAINYVNEDTELMPLNEFKLFKFHNLVRAAFNLDKFLKVKEKKFYSNTKIKVGRLAKKAKNVLFGETAASVEENIYCYIGNDNKADICVRQYPFAECDLGLVTNFLENACYEYNDVLISQCETSRVYYIINPGMAEIRIKESTGVEVEDIASIYENLDNSIDTYLEMLVESVEASEKLVVTTPIENMISNITNCDEFSLDRFKLTLEAMSYFGVDTETVSVFGSKFNDYHFNKAIENGVIGEMYIKLGAQEREVSKLVSEYTIEEGVDWEDKITAYNYISQLLEYTYPDIDYDDDDDEDDEEDETPVKKPEVKKPEVGPKKHEEKSSDEKKPEEKKDSRKPSEIYKDELKEIEDMKKDKNPPKGAKSGGLNLNSIKLGMMGLKEKYKTFSGKFKEKSRALDASVRMYVKSMKDTMSNDRREAIIKGRVIPSFSNCIKAGVALAAIGYVSLPLACITALGGLAMSKKLNEKEKLLLLDEIETELEVVDKELAIADSNNEIKKYRELLKYKKELQRQYQRIKYNIRVGKDLITPSSGSGVKGSGMD